MQFKALAGIPLALWMLVPVQSQAALPIGQPAPCPPNMSCAPSTPPTTPPSAPGTCGPPTGGATCAAAGPASLNSAPAVNVGAGNPINVITGNKYQREVDMPALPGVLGLEIVRHYNSAYSRPNHSTNLLGRGWKLSYETELHAGATNLQIVQADGARTIFSRDPRNPSLCASTDPADGQVEIRRGSRATEYRWRWPNGRELTFNQNGKLVQILAPGGQFVTLQYDARQLLASVTDPQGRRLQFSYPERGGRTAGGSYRGVQRIVSPVGTFTYGYGSAKPAGAQIDDAALIANLVKVQLPSGARYYHYEDARFPTLLTGISQLVENASGQPSWQRVATYGYDANGKGNLTVKGYPARLAGGPGARRLAPGSGIEQVTLDHSAPGQTTIRNSLGQPTVYRHGIVAGQYRLLEVRGAGCASCGPSNVRYAYDRAGRLTDTIELGTSGAPVRATHTERDQRGRPVEVSRVSYRDGKRQASAWTVRYRYQGDSAQPALVIRPSVEPGRTVVSLVDYVADGPAQGMPARVTEAGFIPAAANGGRAQPIKRSVSYGYNGYGQRVLEDGPLPNGADARTAAAPANSDITERRFDPVSKLLTRVAAPGGAVTEVIERDAALRPRVIRTTDGDTVRTVKVSSNWRGQPVEIRVDAGFTREPGKVLTRRIQYRYDLAGRLLALTQPGGAGARFSYDAAGRLVAARLADGKRISVQHDSESRGIGNAVYDEQGKELFAGPRLRYGADGRLAEMLGGAQGSQAWEYDDAGRVIALTNGAGVPVRFEYDEQGLLAARTVAGGTPDAATIRLQRDDHGNTRVLTDPNGVATTSHVDDFGRKVMEINPDRGVTAYRHDEAGRLVGRADDSGGVTHFRYDLAGRLIGVGGDARADLVRYRYQGAYLAHQKSDGEEVAYVRNGFGQVLEERRTIQLASAGGTGSARVLKAALPAPRPVTFVTRSEYDEAGRLQAQTLPDGHRVEYRFDAGGALQAMLFDGTPVASAISHSAPGMASYTASNGVRNTIRLDRRGRIAAVDASALPQQIWLARVRAWLGQPVQSGAQLVYRQRNSYDEGGRIVAIERQQAGMAQRTERYGYDAQDRLVAADLGDGRRSGWTYDAGGNRLTEYSPAAQRQFRYADGTNRLQAMGLDGGISAAWAYHPAGLPLAQFGMVQASGRREPTFRRIVYNGAKRPVAVYDGGRLVARYQYNVQGERVAKTVFPASAQDAGPVRRVSGQALQGITTYSLYRDQRLAAEADGDGRITAHYLYLDGRPVARVDVDAAAGRPWWRRVLDALPGAHGGARVYAIHTDHLGTPQLVTDRDRRVVWRAQTAPFGATEVKAELVDGRPFVLDLRLPGQVFDAETRLHQNYMRDYDPAIGRYLTPDPLGLRGGLHPYAYVSNNPLSLTDPLGLYEQDVHYYTTYFLARVAGVDARMAYLIATGTQYIDDNPDTWPLEPELYDAAWDLVTNNDQVRARLSSYHFTQKPEDDPTQDAATRYKTTTDNAQLVRLRNASTNAGQLGSECARAVMYGEYLHAYEDTFAHRRYDNKPVAVNGGFGHAVHGHMPDHTYNESQVLGYDWKYNEERTLYMQEQVYNKLVADWGGSAPARPWSEVKYIMQAFNPIHEDAGNTHEFTSTDPAKSKKVTLLNYWLNKWDYKFVSETGETFEMNLKERGFGQYDATVGKRNRETYLRYENDGPNHSKNDRFKATDPNFSGALLP